jgi:hypothetical protein
MIHDQQRCADFRVRCPQAGSFFYAWRMVAEAAQFKGLEGALAVKRWLESTTFIELPFNAYENEVQCTLVRLDGQVKRYDLCGYFLSDKKNPIAVESKAYATVGHQATAYTEYLANAYSVTARDISTVGDLRREYFWVTSHPFSQSKWPKLTASDEIREALKIYPDALDGRHVEEDLVRTVASRLWLLVRHERQEEITMSRNELQHVFTVLQRKV